MTEFEVHRRQWVITRGENRPADFAHYTTVRLHPSENVFLHHHGDLPIARHGQDGPLVLGTYVGDFTSAETAHYLTGHFVVISWPWLSLNAFGSMGVHYFPSGSEVVCSPSVAVLSEFSGLPITGRTLQWKTGMNWDPLPSSRIDGARKLFCDEALNLATGDVAVWPRHVRSDIDEEQAITGLAEYMAGVVTSLPTKGNRILLPLSAGKDSRLVFSALLATGTPFEAYTNLQDGKTSETDARIAALLCKRFGIRHQIVTAEGHNAAAADAHRRHTGGSEGDAGFTLAIGNFRRILRAGDFPLGAGGVEIGRRFYARKFQGIDMVNPATAPAAIAHSFNETDPRVVEALALWHQHRTRHPIPNLDLIDAFYLDQRLGGWLSSNSIGGLFPAAGLPPMISWRCIDLLMATSPERRTAGVIQMRAMDRLLPGVSTIVPINPLPPLQRARKAIESAIIGSPLDAPSRILLHCLRRIGRGSST